MPRRWKVALTISGTSALAMIYLFLNPAYATSHAPAASTLPLAAALKQHSPPATGDTVQKPMAIFHAPLTRTYKVRPNDSLSSIAARVYGKAGDWPVLYWANKAKIQWAAQIRVGQVLTVPLLPAKIPAPPAAVAPAAATTPPVGGSSPTPPPTGGSGCGLSGTLSYGQLESLWVCGGGPSWAEASAASIAECESGGNQYAYNPSGASGYWQILGQVVGGDIFNPLVNAENAVAKFRDSGDTFAQWTCQATAVTKAHLMAFVTTHRLRKRLRAAGWALSVKGCRYTWGGTRCTEGFDCSGLVMRAWEAAGVQLPRTTTEMLGSWHLVRIPEYQARKGDLAFFGSGHVELVWYEHNGVVRYTYGARDWGTTVHAWRDRFFRPTAYYRIRS